MLLPVGFLAGVNSLMIFQIDSLSKSDSTRLTLVVLLAGMQFLVTPKTRVTGKSASTNVTLERFLGTEITIELSKKIQTIKTEILTAVEAFATLWSCAVAPIAECFVVVVGFELAESVTGL